MITSCLPTLKVLKNLRPMSSAELILHLSGLHSSGLQKKVTVDDVVVRDREKSSFDFIGDEEDEDPYPLSSAISPGFGFPPIMVSVLSES